MFLYLDDYTLRDQISIDYGIFQKNARLQKC